MIIFRHWSGKKNLLKLLDIMSYVNVVNIRHNRETEDKCRGREATEVSTLHEWQCVYVCGWGGGTVMYIFPIFFYF